MGFVQIIQFTTSRIDEMEALGAEWQAAAGSDSTARRRIMCKDRDKENSYLNIVFFDSYEDAMRNSELPATGEFSGKLAALLDGPPTFLNLDLVEDRSL